LTSSLEALQVRTRASKQNVETFNTRRGGLQDRTWRASRPAEEGFKTGPGGLQV
ncbi:unnamed protein product, partial [Nesidiocoris tenuis]